MDEQQKLESEEQQSTSSLTVFEYHRMTLIEKAKYALSVGLPSGIVLEVFGASATGLALAALLGLTAGFFSEEIQAGILDKLPAPKGVGQSRAGKLAWWFLGDVPKTPDERVAQDNPTQPVQEESPPASPETLDKVVRLSDTLQLHIDDLAGKAVFIAGIRRSGKTTLGARIAEELGRHLIPLLIPDQEGDYLSLAEVLPRSVIAGHPSANHNQYPCPRFAGLTIQTAPAFGFALLEKGYQVILDLSTYSSLEEAVIVQVGCIRGMFAFAEAYPDQRVTSHVYLDEAQRYLPQTLSDSIIQDRSVLSALLKVYMDVIAIGGKRGIAPVILSQRFAQVNNKIMAQTEVFFLMRQTMDNDLKRCMEYAKRSIATEEQISSFRQGQGIYIGADGTQLVTRFHKRQSSGIRSHTPKAEAAERYANVPLPTDFSVSTSGNSGNTLETATETPPQANSAKIIKDVFPASSQETETEQARSESGESLVSDGILEAIRRMKEKNYRDREIAQLVGLSGRKYGIYQQVLRQLGYAKEAQL